MQYILLALVYFRGFINFSWAKGVRTSKESRPLSYLERKYYKGIFYMITRVFFVKELGCHARENSL
jgi:hypothetical protein